MYICMYTRAHTHAHTYDYALICFRTFHKLIDLDSLRQVNVQEVEGYMPTLPCDQKTCTGEDAVDYCIDCCYKLCDKHVQVVYFSLQTVMYTLQRLMVEISTLKCICISCNI